MVEYCVYWLENGEPMHEVFSNLAAAEMYSCAIRGKENVEWVEVSEEEAGKSSVSCPLKPSDSAPLKHSTMPP